MQMTGQETIAASRQQVWDLLLDPETLKRCIPGCQSLTQESDNRLRVIAEIKIGPIGARFNALVTRTDIVPLTGYTMQIEGQGGTVGFVKSRATLRLSDDGNGKTLLGYDVDAEVGGRLAQLGGPILDATSKQLSGRFFRQLGSVLSPALEASALLPSTAAALRAPTQTHAPVTQAASSLPMTWVLALCVAALVGYLVGHAGSDAHGSDWMGLAIGLLVVIVAAAGFEFGRRAAPVVTIDPHALARLLQERKP